MLYSSLVLLNLFLSKHLPAFTKLYFVYYYVLVHSSLKNNYSVSLSYLKNLIYNKNFD